MDMARVFRPMSVFAAALLAALSLTAALAPAQAAVEIQRVESSGGIQAWLVEEHSIPLISMRFGFKGGGTAQDPEGLEGLANLMSGLLDEGAGEIKSQEFLATLRNLSISLSYRADRDSFTGRMRTLSQNKEEAFDLLTLSVNRPRFDQKPVDRIRSQIIAGLKRSRTDPDRIAGKAFFGTLFSGHPYERPYDGTEESLLSITPQDLSEFHKRIFGRDALKIAVVGDISADELGVALDRIFLSLPEKSQISEVSAIELPESLTESTELDVPQTVIRFALPAVSRDDPDFFPTFVMAHILGGGAFSSWLYKEVREKRGLAYSAYAYLSLYDHSQFITGGTATRAENTEEAIELIKRQFSRMASEGPTGQELEAAKKYLTGSYALRFDTSGNIASQLLGLQLSDLEPDYVRTRNGKVEAVTLEDVKRVANRLLAGRTPSFVIVGRQPG